MIVRIVLFAVAGAAVFMKFRPHLLSFNTHAPYVFTAFELLLGLMFLNMPFVLQWPPDVWSQALSWFLLIASAAFAVGGFTAIKRYGKAGRDWEDTTELVKKGVFRYIRHPLYSSLMLLSVGLLLRNVGALPVVLCLCSLAFLAMASVVEEKENTAKFGDLYREYMEGTRRYIPFVL